MSENDFLHALREKMPQTFGEELLAQLKAQDAPDAIPVQTSEPKPVKTAIPVRRTFWTIAAASILAVLLGFVIVVTRSPADSLLQQPSDVLSFTQSAPITSQNINLLQPFATLGDGIAYDLALSPDGETLAVATSLGISLHDANDLNAEPTLVDVNGAGVSKLIYRSDGKIAGVTSEQRVFIYDPQADELNELFSLPANTLSFRFSGDATQLLTLTCAERVEAGEACPDKWSIAFFDIDLTKQGFRRNFLIFAEYPQIAVTEDFSLLAFTQLSETEDNIAQIMLYDLENAGLVKPVLEIPLGITSTDLYLQNIVRSMDFSPDGSQLVISLNSQYVRGLISREGRIGKSIQVWDVEQLLAQDAPQNVSGDVPTVAALDGAIIQGLVFGATSDTLLRVSNEGLIVLDLNQPDEMGEYLHIGSPNIETVHFSPDGERMYILAYGASIQEWDWQNRELLQQNTKYRSTEEFGFAFSADSTQMLSSSQLPLFIGTNFVDLWDLQQEAPQANMLPTIGQAPVQVAMDDEMAANLPQISMPVNLAVMSLDGRYVAYQGVSSYTNSDLYLLDLVTGEQRILLEQVQVYLLQFSTDGTLFARITNSGIVYRWSPQAVAASDVNPTSFTVPLTSRYTVYPVRDKDEVAPNGQLVAVYECQQTQEQLPSGFYLGDCSREVLGIGHVENRDLFERILVDTEGFGALTFAQDSQTLAFGACMERGERECSVGQVSFYDVREMTESQATSSLPDVPLINMIQGFTSLPIQLVFHPMVAEDGSQIVAIRLEEGGVELWRWSPDGESELWRTLDTIENPIAFSPDGRFLATSRRGQIEFWGVPLEGIVVR
ncbi:MAG: WD40 repeat domain-containing protein [Anaerolineae bacterium]|nr:WD40 repeat domain-containing protein [Anaerolineae bacterium]